MIKHTPSPWHLMETEPGIDAEMDVFVTTPRYAGGIGLIARVINADDAMLIAAAPDLLEALQTIMASVAGCEREAKWESARAAISKATGESK
jgi:hypothetical protein